MIFLYGKTRITGNPYLDIFYAVMHSQKGTKFVTNLTNPFLFVDDTFKVFLTSVYIEVLMILTAKNCYAKYSTIIS